MTSSDRLARGNASVADPEDPRLGRVVADRYELVARVGPGTLGLVYQARHTALERLVTLELLDAELIDREAVRERFKSTMQQLSRVRHRNVVELESFGVDHDGSLYVVTKHVAAPRLHELVERERRLPWARARGLALEIAAALEAIHRRALTHGGLRPESCHVVSKASGAEEVLVSDATLGELAIETRFAADAKGATTRLAGDPRYLALEQFVSGRGSVAADVYAVGAVLYHALAGVPPHSGVNAFHALHQRGRAVTPLRAIAPSVPVEVEAIVMRALAVEPSERHPTMRELAAALGAIPAQAGAELQAVPVRAVATDEGSFVPPIAEPPPPPPMMVAPSPMPLATVEDDATVMMARHVPQGGAAAVEATTMLSRSSAPSCVERPHETTVLEADELRTIPLVIDRPGMVAARHIATPVGAEASTPRVAPAQARGPVLGQPFAVPPTEVLTVAAAAGPAPLVTERLPAPTARVASHALAPTLAPTSVLAPPVPSRVPTAPPLAPPPSVPMVAQPPPAGLTWLLLLGAVLVVAAIGALVGLALARASEPDRAPAPEHPSPATTPTPRRSP